MLAAVAAVALSAYAAPSSQGLVAVQRQDPRANPLPVSSLTYAPPRSQGLWAGYQHDLGTVPLPPAMRRPLRLPRLAPGAPCPTSEPTMFSSIWGPGLGSPGPVYTVGFGDQPVLHYAYPSTGRWTFQKTMWPVAGSYTGPVRIRGHQMAGP